jgi:Holliday junction resolvase RusA-like endonuclease
VIFSFSVPGPIYAYRRLRDHGGYRNYDQFKKRVLLLAMVKGWRMEETAPDRTRSMEVIVYWRKGPRVDLSNVIKGIEDALFSQDRWIVKIRAQALSNQAAEKVEVTIL